MASPRQQPLGTFPFAIRTPDGRHAKVIGHFTPLEWPPSEEAFDLRARDAAPSPVFVLTEMVGSGSPAVLPAMRLGAADTVEWLDNESPPTPERDARSRHSIIGSPNMTIPDTATHSGPTRRRSLPRLWRSKSDATLPRSRVDIGHPQPFLPYTRSTATSNTPETCHHLTPRLLRKSSLEVPWRGQHRSTRSVSPSSLVTTFSNWTVKKRDSMKRKSGEDLHACAASTPLPTYEGFNPQPSSGLGPSPLPYADYPIRAPLRKRASMPAAWMQAVPCEQSSELPAPPASPSRHAPSHSISTDSNAEAFQRLVAAHNRSTPPVPPPPSSAAASTSKFRGGSSIRASYVIKRKPVMAWTPTPDCDDFGASSYTPTRKEFAKTATDVYGTGPRVRTLKPRQSRRSLLSYQRDEPGSGHSVLSYLQTKALDVFKRKLRKKAPQAQRQQPQQQQQTDSATKGSPVPKPSPIAKRVRSFVSLRQASSSVTSLSTAGTETSGEDYDENAATIMKAESVRLGYQTIVRNGRDPTCPVHGDGNSHQEGPLVVVKPLRHLPRENGFPRVSSASPWSEGSVMLPSSSSEEDIGLAISTDNGGGNLTPSRMATVSRARAKAHYLNCPTLVPDTASDSGGSTASSANTPEAGNSPLSSPLRTPPKQIRGGPPAQPPPAGPLPPIPFPVPRATPPKLRPAAIPKIEVSVNPEPTTLTKLSGSEEPVFKLYNPSRERFQEALDRVHDTVWHGSIRETKREHRRNCSMSSFSSEDTRRFMMQQRRSRKAMSSADATDDELTMASLLSSWSLCECSEDGDTARVLQDNESGVLDTLDWLDPGPAALPPTRE